MMRFLLLQENTAQPSQRRGTFCQSFFDTIQNGLPQSFENHLLSKERLHEIAASKCIVQNLAILFQGRKKRPVTEVLRCKPGNGALKNPCMHRFLLGLAKKKSSRPRIFS